MAQSQFSLTWDAHKKNICNGLSGLQQNGEFVDMTLAADGHLVKVHQVIMALASPYIKELISSAQCRHPVIFLNKISYTTLCAILEYIYTGEVLISIENLTTLVEAGKELHIRGLEDMNLNETGPTKYCNASDTDCNSKALDDEICYFEVTSPKDEKVFYSANDPDVQGGVIVREVKSLSESVEKMEDYEDMQEDNENDTDSFTIPDHIHNVTITKNKNTSVLQYTVSNQGSLQMILNRYMYYLKHTNKNNSRHWRCVDYLNSVKCPAHIVTQDDIVLQRTSAHTHSYHDKKILKKVRSGAVFTAIREAEEEGNVVRLKCAEEKQKLKYMNDDSELN